jgi:Uri superfamily endonuclease
MQTTDQTAAGGAAPVFPAARGSYILSLHLSEPAHLVVGRLGAFDFPAGWYAYAGSAFGPGGLRGRLKHHLAPVTKAHWHIDYLRAAALVYDVWYCVDETTREHQWAGTLRSLPGAAIPAPRFGASDCRCDTHLIGLRQQPDFAAFCHLIGATMQRWKADN